MAIESKTILMTGVTDGFGKIAACALANDGASVYAFSRNVEKGKMLQQYLSEKYLNAKGSITIIDCDLCSFESIVNACTALRQRVTQLDMIVNNAGIMNFEYKETSNHIEETLQVNLLAPLLLSHLLIDLLVKSKEAKLIFTASGLHQGTINFTDLEFKQQFISYKSYSQSKLGIILMCRLLGQKLAKNHIGVYCQHPGMVNTNLGHSAGWFSKLFFQVMGKSTEKGSKTLLYLINTPKQKLISGEYYADCAVKKITKESNDLNVAQQLSDCIKDYLKKYISSTSLIFD